MKYNKKKTEKREIDVVALFLLIGLIVSYAILGYWAFLYFIL